MSKIGKIILTLLAALMFGGFIWKLYPYAIIKLNFSGFFALLIGIAIFYFSIWKSSAKSSYSILDKISLWLLIVCLIFLFPTFLISLRISWFFNTAPQFGFLFLASGMGLIFCVSLIHKLLRQFFTNVLWILDLVHVSAPFWMPAIAPLKISLGADLTLPELFKWPSTYVYYVVVLCVVIFGFILHKKQGEPNSLLIKNKIVPLERLSLKIALTVLMGLFIFISGALLKKYSIEVKDLVKTQAMGGFSIVGGFENRINMAKVIFYLSGGCCVITFLMMIWIWFVKEIARLHTQISLILLPLMGITIFGQWSLFISEKMALIYSFIKPTFQMPSFKYGYYVIYIGYGIILFLSYILIRGLLLPKQNIQSEKADSEILKGNDKGEDVFLDSGNTENNMDSDNPFNSTDTLSASTNFGNNLSDSEVYKKSSTSSNQEDKLLNLLLKVLIGLVVAVVVVLGVSYYLKSKKSAYNEVIYGDSQVKVKYLTGEMLQFVKENYPQETKRLFVFLPELENATCPYMQDFVQGLRQAKSNPQWTGAYHFMPAVNSVSAESRSEADEKVKKIQVFIETVCGNACIIDMQENWVFEIKRGDLIPTALESFKK